MTDLHAAAARLRRHDGEVKCNNFAGSPYYRPDEPRQWDDVAVSDDQATVTYFALPLLDSTPIPDDLSPLGFREISDACRPCGWSIDSTESIHILSRGYRGRWLIDGREMQEQPETMGQLRMACKVLGITLQESHQ